MHHKNLQILIIVIVIVIISAYFWQNRPETKTQESELQLNSLDNVSGELNSALQPSQYLYDLLE